MSTGADRENRTPASTLEEWGTTSMQYPQVPDSRTRALASLFAYGLSESRVGEFSPTILRFGVEQLRTTDVSRGLASLALAVGLSPRVLLFRGYMNGWVAFYHHGLVSNTIKYRFEPTTS